MRKEQQEKITNQVVDVQEPDALDELLEKVDLNDPVDVKDGAGNTVAITKQQFIEHYMPKGSSQSEAFHCFQAVRATGLSLLVPGECYFFKTGEGHVSLFTGYKAYLRKAYAAGLEHIETPDIIHDIDGKLEKCNITLKIRGRDDFNWPTWYTEVVSLFKGEPNSRWKKAPNQMFIKCAVVNTLRMSGLVDFTLPYIIEEMADPVIEGYRTLTEAQAEGHELPEASLGEVTATTHQVDMTPFRKKYFWMLKELGMSFASDEARRHWQKQKWGIDSISDLDVEGYADLFATLAALKSELKSKEDPDTDSPAGANATESVTDDPDAPRYHSGTDTAKMVGAETAEEQEEKDTPDDTFLLTDETHKEIKLALRAFPEQAYGTIGSKGFRDWAADLIGHRWKAIKSILEDEGKNIVAHLKAERGELELAEKAAQGIQKPEPEDDPEDNPSGTQAGEITEDVLDINEDEVDFIEPYIHKAHTRFSTKLQRKQWESKNELPDLKIGDWPVTELKRGIALLEEVPEIAYCTKEQRAEMETLIKKMPKKYEGTLYKQPFKSFMSRIIVRKIEHLRELTELEASDIIHEMNDAIQDEVNKPTVI